MILIKELLGCSLEHDTAKTKTIVKWAELEILKKLQILPFLWKKNIMDKTSNILKIENIGDYVFLPVRKNSLVKENF